MSDKKIIFLVDDDMMFSQSVKFGLESKGDFEVIDFPTGEKMIEYLKTENIVPDAIVLDYILNSVESDAKGGDKILEILRKEYKTRTNSAPIIMLSGKGEVQDAVNLLKKGAKDYIIKEGNYLDVLLNSIRKIFELREIRKEKDMYKDQAASLKKRLMITLGFVVVFVVVVGVYFLFFSK